MSKKYHVQERTFLNLQTEMRAYIWKRGQIELKLADCSREVSFDFDLSSKEDRENSLYKIRKIAEVVNAVHQAIETEAESIEERQSFTPKMKAMAAVH